MTLGGTGGQSQQADPGVPDRPGTPGTAPYRPDHVIGDNGYSSTAIRTRLRRRGIGHTIPERTDQIRNRLRRGRHGGGPLRPPDLDGSERCRQVIEATLGQPILSGFPTRRVPGAELVLA